MALFAQQEREEEEREEAARLDAQKLEGAFNNLDFDDGDSSLSSPPGGIRYKGHSLAMVTSSAEFWGGCSAEEPDLHPLWPGGAGDVRQHGA